MLCKPPGNCSNTFEHMSRGHTDLSTFDNSHYHPGSLVRRSLWYFTSLVWFRSGFPVNSVKVTILRVFGARIGKGVVIKPHVIIKYPWLLSVGDYSWIGEKVWIDNLAQVTIGAHCCISQGAMLLCGNHDYKKSSFDLMTLPIVLEDGVWIGARATVCPGVHAHSHAVLTAGSVATGTLEAYTVYRGNPAVRKGERMVEKF